MRWQGYRRNFSGKCSGVEIASVVNHFYLCDKQVNKPWSFSGLFKNIPSNVKITLLAADPKLSGDVSGLEHVPRNVDVNVLTGIGHWIQFESPDTIMAAIPLPRAKL